MPLKGFKQLELSQKHYVIVSDETLTDTSIIFQEQQPFQPGAGVYYFGRVWMERRELCGSGALFVGNELGIGQKKLKPSNCNYCLT